MKSKIKIILIGLILIGLGYAVDENTVSMNTDNTLLFQGYLTSDDGKPFFGTATMGFKFYKEQSAVTDNVIISNEVSPVLIRAVQVYNGQYATKLALPTDYLDILKANQQKIWIEIWVAEGSPGNLASVSDLKPMTPLVQLTAVAQALSVRGIYYDNDATVIKIGNSYREKNYASANNNIDLVVSGNVGIGTDDTSAARLVVIGNMDVTGGGDVRVSGNITPGEIKNDTTGGVFGAVWN